MQAFDGYRGIKLLREASITLVATIKRMIRPTVASCMANDRVGAALRTRAMGDQLSKQQG
jgi:hypothetical protein